MQVNKKRTIVAKGDGGDGASTCVGNGVLETRAGVVHAYLGELHEETKVEGEDIGVEVR